MAYRISATTDGDLFLLNQMRELAYQQRLDVSEVMRRAFQAALVHYMLSDEPAEVAPAVPVDELQNPSADGPASAGMVVQPGWLFSEARQQWRDPEGLWHDQLPDALSGP